MHWRLNSWLAAIALTACAFAASCSSSPAEPLALAMFDVELSVTATAVPTTAPLDLPTAVPTPDLPPTATAIPPTAVPTPDLPPTATPDLPPTATPDLPPTATAIPPTATAVPAAPVAAAPGSVAPTSIAVPTTAVPDPTPAPTSTAVPAIAVPEPSPAPTSTPVPATAVPDPTAAPTSTAVPTAIPPTATAEPTPAPAGEGGRPAPRVVTNQGYVTFGQAGLTAVSIPSALVEVVGFHQASHPGAQEIASTSTGLRTMVLASRSRGTPLHSAADIVVPPGEPLRAPVTGTVIAAREYVLYCQYSDKLVYIEPDGLPGWQVRLFHVQGEIPAVGARVIAGETIVASGGGNLLPFESQVDEFTAEPSWAHVHLEVVDTSVPDTRPPGGGC